MNRCIPFLMSALLMVSCAKEAATEQKDEPSGKGGGKETSTFEAFTPGYSKPEDSKTTVDISAGGVINWSANDKVYVSTGDDKSEYTVKKGGFPVATLSSDKEIKGDNYYAIYPATGASYEDGNYNLVIPDVQKLQNDGTFSTNTFPMVATCGAERKLSFKNAAGLIKIVPTGSFTASIISMSVSAKESMAGSTVVKMSEGIPAVTCLGTNEINLTCGVNIGQPIYVVVAPGKYTNVSLSFKLSTGATLITALDKPVEVKRSQYTEVPCSLDDVFVDLSKSGTANCYAINKPGCYKFKATVRGNGVQTNCKVDPNIPLSSIASVVKYFTDGGKFLSSEFELNEEDGYIYFTTVNGTLPAGTALVSVRSSNGKTLWSWHIWANAEIADVQAGSSTWMNMNLGAHQTGWNDMGYMGYYYQWGRKDPMMQQYSDANGFKNPWVSRASQIDGSIQNSIENPVTFYGSYYYGGDSSKPETRIADWNTYQTLNVQWDLWCKGATGPMTGGAVTKTMFDPCPPGYNVPTADDFSQLSSSAGSWEFEEHCWIHGATGMKFPQTGTRGVGVDKSIWAQDNTKASYIWSALPANAVQASNGQYQIRACRGWIRNGAGMTTGDDGAFRAIGVCVRCVKSK